MKMLRWFKKHFIPHEGNDHRPHFLRTGNIRNLVLIVLLIEFGVLLLPFIPALDLVGNRFTASVLPSVLDDLTNENRLEQHLAVLTVNPLLNKVAELKAKDMAEKGYFAHVSPEGKAPWYWFKEVGYDYEYAGENLAVDFKDSKDVTLAWMNSPTHRANIVKDAYTEIGTGIATGTYKGNATIFVAQAYGRPAGRVEEVGSVLEGDVEEGVEEDMSSEIADDEGLRLATAETNVLSAQSSGVATRTPSVPKSVMTDTAPPQTYVKTNIFQKYVTYPRHAANIVFAILGALVGLALLLKLFIRMDKRHPRLVTNGLIVLVLIFGVYLANDAMAKSKMEENVSFMGFSGE